MSDSSTPIGDGWPVVHLTQDTFIVPNGYRCALDSMDTAVDSGQEPRIVLTRDTRIDTGGFRATLLTPQRAVSDTDSRTWDVFLRDGGGERRVGPIMATDENMAMTCAIRWYGDVLRVAPSEK